MTVSWNTFAQIDAPFVEFGESPRHLDQRANASAPSVTYPTSRTWNHHVSVARDNSQRF